ncbi:DNA gyrase inhibitor [Sporanaerobium hydrogeniformans]|uniref:DNA gyrase inhibitor n=1 Tax=Sporanaerobium hydrogeniformans TaxID=3072179 RepID=A0AC61DBY2_9FIRM|nr:GyrI-like domain-containing protein [Sporanaerobium hydrogeniformans]PHV70784.1 DNA gyrase inhibitor [Sporanaerobium hydrogeniformans]
MNIKIETISPSTIAYYRRYGAYGVENIETMEKLKSWATTNNYMDENSIILGIAHDNVQLTKPENCRYDACIVLGNNTVIGNDTITIGKISGGKYAVFTIEHTASAMQKAWSEIFPTISKSKYEVDYNRPIMERYIAKLVANHYCEICVPIL